MSNINILLVGKGYWGKNWYRTLLDSGHTFSVCDTFLLNELDANGIQQFSDIDQAFSKNKFEYVIVASSADNHAKIFEKCVLNGVDRQNVLIEKPCGTSIDETQSLYGCFPGFLFLYSAPFRYIKNNIDLIGKPLFLKSIRASMGPRIRTDVSIVEDYLIHDLYISLELFGNNVKNCKAMLKKDFQSPIQEDTISCQFELGDVMCDVFSSWRYPIKKREIIITGEKGSFIWVNDSLSISTDRYIKIDGKDSLGNVGYKLIEEGVKTIDFDSKTTLANELQAFLDCGKPNTSISDVWNLIKVIKG